MKATEEKRIDARELLKEFRQTIKENYVVLTEENPSEENAIVLRYLNGQRFSLSIREIKP
jgi:hypothetical protein